MVEHQVKNDPYVAFLRCGHQAIEILKSSVLRIDCFVIFDVVSEVHLRRRVEGRNPDCVDPKLLKIAKVFGDAVQVADPVAVRVRETARIDLVNYSVFPPRAIGTRLRSLRRVRLSLVRGLRGDSRQEATDNDKSYKSAHVGG